MLSDERRREIADFLKTRRMRRQPEELGLPRGRRRRTPGLRREEVAAAAGVSAEWYTWLEQAREVRPSAEVLTPDRRSAPARAPRDPPPAHARRLRGPGERLGSAPVGVGEPPAPAADRSDGLRPGLGVRGAVGHRGLEPRRVGHPRRPRRPPGHRAQRAVPALPGRPDAGDAGGLGRRTAGGASPSCGRPTPAGWTTRGSTSW